MTKATKKITEQPTIEQKTELPLDGSGAQKFIEEQGGISKAMRVLSAAGHKPGPISKMLNKRYQHVRNVLITPVGKSVK